jgi:hypothetical protein
MTRLNSLIRNTQIQLDKLRAKTIGLFKLHGHYHLVLSIEDDLIHGVYIGEFGTVQELHCNKNEGVYYPIPERYSSYYDLLQNVEGYLNWFNTCE